MVQERWVASRCVGQVCREEDERRTVHRARPSRERWADACVVRRRTSTRVPWIAVPVVLTNVVVRSDPFETLLLLSRREKKPSPPTSSNPFVCVCVWFRWDLSPEPFSQALFWGSWGSGGGFLAFAGSVSRGLRTRFVERIFGRVVGR